MAIVKPLRNCWVVEDSRLKKSSSWGVRGVILADIKRDGVGTAGGSFQNTGAVEDNN